MSEYRAVSRRRRRTKQLDKFLFLDAAHTVAPSFFFHLFLSFPLSLTRRRANLLALTLPHLTRRLLRFFIIIAVSLPPPHVSEGIHHILFLSLASFPFSFLFPFLPFFSSCLLFLLSWSESNNEKDRVGKGRKENSG